MAMGGSFTIPATEMKGIISQLIQNKVGEPETEIGMKLSALFV